MNNFIVAGVAITALYFYLQYQSEKNENDTEVKVPKVPLPKNGMEMTIRRRVEIFPPQISKQYNAEKWATVSPINIKFVRE